MNRSKNTTPQKRTLFDYFKSPKKSSTSSSPVASVKTTPSPKTPIAKESKVIHNLVNEIQKPSVVGKQIKVYWPNDDEWYEGSIIEQQDEKYRIKYADGEIEWIDSSIEVFEIIPPSTPVKTQSTIPSQSSMFVEKSASTYPTQSSTYPTQSSTLPTQISSIPAQSSTYPTQSSTLPTQISSIPTQSSTLPTQISSTLPTQISSALPTQLSSISSQSSATSTPQKDSMHSVEAAIRKLSPATRKKKCAQLRRLLDSSEDEEEGYVPKENEEEESDDSLSMDVESEDEPIAVKKRRIIVADSDSDEPIAKSIKPPSKKPKVTANPLAGYAFNSNQSTPVKSTTSSTISTPKKSPASSKKSPASGKKSPSTETSMVDDEAGLEKKGAVILNAGEHAHDHIEWMIHPKDKNGNDPSSPDYDPTSLYVPPSYVKGCTNGMKQWWSEKQKAYDCVLLMKVGKFYETYHMDADIMVKELDLVYMKGETAHAGFPEAAYSKFSNILVNKGYRVARVEQTETPQQMKERNARSAVKSQVVRREICSILTPGVAGHGVVDKIYNQKDHRILCSVVEVKKNLNLAEDEIFMNENEIGKKMVEGGITEAVIIGVCFVDTVMGKFYIGEFLDDDQRTALRTQLLRFAPTEFVLHKKAVLPHTIQLLHQECSSALITFVDPTSSFAASNLTPFIQQNHVFQCDDDTSSNTTLPSLLTHLLSNQSSLFEPCLSSLYLCSSYLNRCCIANLLMSQKRFFCIDNIDKEKDLLNSSFQVEQTKQEVYDDNQIMILDAVTLKNLDILPDPTNPNAASLFQYVDHTVTPFGKRLLKEWLTQPLLNIDAINERLDAVEELTQKPELVQKISSTFKGIADIDRLLSRLRDYCTSILHKSHPDNRAQYYEDKKYNVRKIKDFVQLMEVIHSIIQFVQSIQDTFSSSLLQSIFTIKPITEVDEKALGFPDMSEVLDFFDHSFNHEIALEQGIIMPKPGMDLELDNIKQQLTETENDLKSYLEQIRSQFKCQKIEYFGSNKDRYQLQFPESVCQRLGNMPKEFLLKSQRKGFKRFWTPYIQEKFALLQQLEDKKQLALKNVTASVFNRFYSHITQWSQIVQCASYMDVLHSLAITSTVGDNRGECTRPQFIQRKPGSEPILYLEESRHPCVTSTYSQGSFISNTIGLGDNYTLCKIITGPNMGGKSTLLRQVAVNIILAQIGCFVPASCMRLTPVDRIFTRIGAQDRILSNQSTFYVELIETSLILSNCTEDSFLIIDELGRGTSTFDGSAIVYAVLKYLSQEKHCRLLFSTHYNFIIQSFIHHPSISTGYMSYLLEKEKNEEGEEKDKVTFMYKLVDGVCPDSFGINVARLAHIPENVLTRAKEMADVFNIDMNLQTPEMKYYLYKQLLNHLKELDSSDESYLSNVRSLLQNVV